MNTCNNPEEIQGEPSLEEKFKAALESQQQELEEKFKAALESQQLESERTYSRIRHSHSEEVGKLLRIKGRLEIEKSRLQELHFEIVEKLIKLHKIELENIQKNCLGCKIKSRELKKLQASDN